MIKKWSIRDDLELYELQSDYTVSDIAKKLGTSKEDVRYRIKVLGLRDFDDKAPVNYVIYKVLEIHNYTAQNRFIIAGILNMTIAKVTAYRNQAKRMIEKKKPLTAINGIYKIFD